MDGQPVVPKTVGKMAVTMEHRGPDSDGVWVDGPVGLGHRRLAIIDLTTAAHQPMVGDTGDAVLVYNGELYNYVELRNELRQLGHRFRSDSDTEVVLKSYEEWGPDCVERFNGHFAMGIWDSRRKELFLARDRFGVKPLYFYNDGAKFLFGSEIKSILEYPGVPRSVCYPALNQYFTFQNILTDETMFEGIKLLPAGCSMTVRLRGDSQPEYKQYWDFRPEPSPDRISVDEAAEELHRLFTQAVERQLMSDVPVGSYLSGGMDSGSITAVARQNLGRLATFTMGFDLSSASGLELGFDEREKSEAMSNLLKTEHYEMVLHAGDMEHIMPELTWHLEDPRVGQSYPNYYVARLAGKFVKVVLSGAGGDELFGGYPWRYYRGLGATSDEEYYKSYYGFWQRLVPDENKASLFTPSAYSRMQGHSTYDIFKDVITPAGLPLATSEDRVNASLYFELKTFLHGLLLVEDKVSMAHGLESRTPFLDNDLVDFAMKLPMDCKLKNLDKNALVVDEDEFGKQRYVIQSDDGKVVLRKAMSRLVPSEITGAVKKGFSAPDASWFRGESIEYINKLLRNPRARIFDYLSPDQVHKHLDEHSSGQVNHRLFIWSLLSFEWWLRKFMN